MWPTFDQDLTKPLVKCYLKRGRSKVSQVDYPLTNIRLIISGQCYECMALPVLKAQDQVFYLSSCGNPNYFVSIFKYLLLLTTDAAICHHKHFNWSRERGQHEPWCWDDCSSYTHWTASKSVHHSTCKRTWQENKTRILVIQTKWWKVKT